MFVDQAELRDVEAFAERCGALNSYEEEQLALSQFFYRRLHLLLACGFDEIRYTPVQVTPAEGEADRGVITANVGSVRALESGAWYHVVYGSEPRLANGAVTNDRPAGIVLFPAPFPKNLNRMLFIPVADVIAACREQPDHAAAVILPPLWYPPQEQPTIQLVDTAKAIVAALRDETMTLVDLNWRQLEEVVAELLRARGLAVDVTPRTNDGGRDILARGELVPGEPTLLAVEVKHMNVVNIGDVREALWANRRFPAVMVATSGRFAAGVVRERTDPDNRFRLMLKDGVALGQWIKEYRSGGA
jgi:hypothetical protein